MNDALRGAAEAARGLAVGLKLPELGRALAELAPPALSIIVGIAYDLWIGVRALARKALR